MQIKNDLVIALTLLVCLMCCLCFTFAALTNVILCVGCYAFGWLQHQFIDKKEEQNPSNIV